MLLRYSSTAGFIRSTMLASDWLEPVLLLTSLTCSSSTSRNDSSYAISILESKDMYSGSKYCLCSTRMWSNSLSSLDIASCKTAYALSRSSFCLQLSFTTEKLSKL
ncbi:hypothetical protein V8G54_005344 [Vigna mungo]|uniref:Uncharacterized protein n=1 Tax=Vigna mungo TaxID=3915 RepID=A0AAQ3P099_VIGMU